MAPERLSTRSWLAFIGIAVVLIVLHELVLEQMMTFGGRAKQQAFATDSAPAAQRQQVELHAEKIKLLEAQVASLRQDNSASSGSSGSPPAAPNPPSPAAASTQVLAPAPVGGSELVGASAAASQRQRALTAPVKCRADFAARANDLGLTHYAAEIGVNDGVFARDNLEGTDWNGIPDAKRVGDWRNFHYTAKPWTGELYHMIDAWGWRPPELERADNEKDEAVHLRTKQRAEANTDMFADKRRVIRGFSHEVARDFSAEYFDWLYIDALHTYDAVITDLTAWWPLLKKGGMASGDDYHDWDDDVMTRWNGNGPVSWRWGVRRAVHAFFKPLGVPVRVTYIYDCYPHPAWYLTKPLTEPTANDRRLAEADKHPLRCHDELPALVNQIGLTTPTKWAQVGPMTVPLPASPPLQVLAVDGATAAADNSFEWLHFSHADDHSYAAVLSALQAWWPKLQSGGMISGDDFVDGSSSRLKQCHQISATDTCLKRGAGWVSTYKARKAVPADWNVEKAVNTFFADFGLEVFVSYIFHCHPHPTWYVMKP